MSASFAFCAGRKPSEKLAGEPAPTKSALVASISQGFVAASIAGHVMAFLKQRQRDRFQVVVFDPYIQFPFAQTRLEALSRLSLAGTADCLTALIQEDAVTP